MFLFLKKISFCLLVINKKSLSITSCIFLPPTKTQFPIAPRSPNPTRNREMSRRVVNKTGFVGRSRRPTFVSGGIPESFLNLQPLHREKHHAGVIYSWVSATRALRLASTRSARRSRRALFLARLASISSLRTRSRARSALAFWICSCEDESVLFSAWFPGGNEYRGNDLRAQPERACA